MAGSHCSLSGLPDVSWYMIPKQEKNVPNEQKIYQMVTEYPLSPLNTTDGHKIQQHFPIYGTPKFTEIGIFGLKINHLATLREGKQSRG
jgi:hypothetical protein